MIAYGVYLPIYFIARRVLFYIFVHNLTIHSFMYALLLS